MPQAIQRFLLVLAASIMFGLYPPAARGAFADGANGVFIILLTTFIRAISLAGFCLYTGNKLFIDKQETIIAVRSGFIQAISIIGILGSLVYLPGPVTVILLFTSTLMLLFFLWFKGEIEINRWLIITTMICFIGISLVVGVWGAQTSYSYIGYLLAMIGAVANASRFYIFGKLTQRKNAAVVGAETFLCASLFLMLLPLYEMPILPQSFGGYGWALLSAIAISAGSFLMFFAIAKIGAFHFSLYNKLEPVFGAIFSALLIGEVLGTSQYIGMILVIASLVTYQVWDYRRKRKSLMIVEEV